MSLYRLLFQYAPEKKFLAYVGAFLAGVSSLFNLLAYYLLYQFFSQLILHQSLQNARIIGWQIFGCMTLYGLLYSAGVLATHLLAFRLEANLRKEGFRHLLQASFSFFDTHSSGQIRKILDSNASDTHTIVAHIIPDTAVALCSPLIVFILMFTVDWRLGVYSFLAVLYGLFCFSKMNETPETMKKYMGLLEKMNGESVEFIRGIPIIKIFQASVQAFKPFYQAIMDYSKFALQYAYSCRKAYVAFQVGFMLLPALLIPCILLVASQDPPLEMLTKFIFFAGLSGFLYTCLMRIMYLASNAVMGANTLEKVEGLFSEMEKQTLQRGQWNKVQDTTLEFQDVHFAYDSESEPIFSGLNLQLDSGKSYALVGSSGGGKSTLAKLISGFYPLSQGKILLGGRPLTEYSAEALNRGISFVFQAAHLFPHQTIYENVLMGRPEASREEVLKALHLAQCDAILAKLEKGADTLIGSEGTYLSGGEVQRIAIARAILKDAPLVILDEATAAADPENEYEMQQAFAQLMKGKTVLLIAHRLSAIRQVDEILAVDHGQVVERGTHADLLKKNGRYASLYALYEQANDWKVR